jgi:3-dehydroquinate synthase
MCEVQQSCFPPRVLFTGSFSDLFPLPTGPILLCIDRGVSSNEIVRLKSALQANRLYEYLMPGGERSKTRASKQKLEDWALAMKIGSNVSVFAVGGGATLDLVAFFAATYARGVPLFLVPSTLLAMADASFGGKCGVNAKRVKNIVGTVYHPHAIFIDSQLLLSLPKYHIQAGLVEIAKHSLLDSKEAFDTVMSCWNACLQKDLPCLEKLIAYSLNVKEKFCSRSKEYRHFLNLGHTMAHGLEGVEGAYLTHGVAVAIGMYLEAAIGFRRGIVRRDVVEKTKEIAALAAPRSPFKGKWSFEHLKRTLELDKKNTAGVPRVVWIEAIGKPYVCHGCTAIPLEWAEVEYAHDLMKRMWP